MNYGKISKVFAFQNGEMKKYDGTNIVMNVLLYIHDQIHTAGLELGIEKH